MGERPRVLVTMSTEIFPSKSKNPASMIRPCVYKLVAQQGIIPVLVPSDLPPEIIEDISRSAHGLVLPGGCDIDPRFYNQERHKLTMAYDPNRDQLEMDLVRWAIEKEWPILALCRGLQIMATATGGNLIQHLPESTPQDHGAGHVANTNGSSLKSHVVNLIPGSRVHDIINRTSVMVGSNHHQAVDPDRLGFFTVSGIADDGTIEAMENRVHMCQIGIQGHGELSEDFVPLFEAFGQAVREFSARRICPLTS